MNVVFKPGFLLLTAIGFRISAVLVVVALLVLGCLMGLQVPLAAQFTVLILLGYWLLTLLRSVDFDKSVLNSLMVNQASLDHKQMERSFTGALRDLDLAVLFAESKARREHDYFTSAISEIGYSSSELSESAEKLSVNIAHQSGATTSIAAAITQISYSIEEISKRIHSACEAAADSQKLASSGTSNIMNVRLQMEEVSDFIEQTDRLLANLDEKTQKVETISSVIRSIADQTNLLALNAAIEAARAGEFGRGFAVVAEEVRALANRSHSSAQEITTNIDDVKNTMEALKSSMENVIQRSQQTVTLAAEAEIILQHIASNTHDVSEQLDGITVASDQQSTAAREISSNIEEVAVMADENSRVAGQASSIAKHLYGLCELKE